MRGKKLSWQEFRDLKTTTIPNNEAKERKLRADIQRAKVLVIRSNFGSVAEFKRKAPSFSNRFLLQAFRTYKNSKLL